MATSRSCIKYLKSTYEIVFYCIGGWNSETCTWNSSFPEEPYKRSVLKNFSKFIDKHKKQPSGGVLPKEKMFLKILEKFTGKNPCQSLSFNKVAGWKPETFRSSHWGCSVKQGVLEIFANVPGKNLCWSLFWTCNFIKEDSDTGAILWNLQTF